MSERARKLMLERSEAFRREKRKSFARTFGFIVAAIVLLFALWALSGCVLVAYYPDEVSYPMEMEGDYYVDVDFTPTYGAAVYYELGPAYPYYYYYTGYHYYYGGMYYYRYYRIWSYGGYPYHNYYYYDGGNYVQIYLTHYYHYDVTVNHWYYNPLPNDEVSYNGPSYPNSAVNYHEAQPVTAPHKGALVSPASPASPASPSQGGPSQGKPSSGKSYPVVKAVPKDLEPDKKPPVIKAIPKPAESVKPSVKINKPPLSATLPSLSPNFGGSAVKKPPKAKPIKPSQVPGVTPPKNVSPGAISKKPVPKSKPITPSFSPKPGVGGKKPIYNAPKPSVGGKPKIKMPPAKSSPKYSPKPAYKKPPLKKGGKK